MRWHVHRSVDLSDIRLPPAFQVPVGRICLRQSQVGGLIRRPTIATATDHSIEFESFHEPLQFSRAFPPLPFGEFLDGFHFLFSPAYFLSRNIPAAFGGGGVGFNSFPPRSNTSNIHIQVRHRHVASSASSRNDHPVHPSPNASHVS